MFMSGFENRSIVNYTSENLKKIKKTLKVILVAN